MNKRTVERFEQLSLSDIPPEPAPHDPDCDDDGEPLEFDRWMRTRPCPPWAESET